ncbi:pilus assembly protein PilM (plasmid) [Coraliomargarita sp. W4R53]
MARTIVGLEITQESVRAVEVTTGRSPVLVASGEVPLPPGSAKDSEVLDQDAVAVALRQLWLRAGIKGHKVVLGIGGHRILVHEYTTKAMRPEPLNLALPREMQDHLPVPVNEAVLDFYPISQIGDQLSGFLVAAVSETVEELIATLAKAKLEATAVDLVPFGLARIARRLAAAGESVAMVHLGDHTSYVVIAVDGIPKFVRIIPIDVPRATGRERDAQPMRFEAFEAGRETVPGQPMHGHTAVRSANAADPVIADVVSRLCRTIASYGSRPGAAAVTSLFLSGAGAAAPGVESALSTAIDATVRTISAGDVIKCKTKDTAGDAFQLSAVSTIGITLGERY